MKTIIYTILTFFISVQCTSAFSIEIQTEVDPFVFLKDRWAISSVNKKHDKHINKAEFWRVSLLLAWFQEISPRKYYVTPIPWIEHNKSYSKYAREAYDLWLLDKDAESIDPFSKMRKLDALEFAFKLFGISTPYYNDQIMWFKDVVNDHPVVSKCLSLWICSGQTDLIFGANKPLTRVEAYQIIVDSYMYVYSMDDEPHAQNQIWALDILQQMIYALETEYYDPDKIDRQQLLYWAMEWLAKSLNDKYTVFMKPDDSADYNESLEGEFEWIWAFVEKVDEGVLITTPINWSPAKQVWLKANDIIIEADWIPLADMWLDEAIKHIKWPKWTSVKLKIDRNWTILEFDVTRQKVNIPSIETETNWNVLIIKINYFMKTTDEDFYKILSENEAFSKIIIDLRSNPWWYLDTAENMLSMLVETWKPILQVSSPYDTEIVSAQDRDKFTWKEIAILIDGASASASEILAWTLQDYGLATVVWEKSFWKWTVQSIEQYFDWSQFKFTIANWLTAKWNSIQDEGVTPDYEIQDDPDGFWDEILNKALSIIK